MMKTINLATTSHNYKGNDIWLFPKQLEDIMGGHYHRATWSEHGKLVMPLIDVESVRDAERKGLIVRKISPNGIKYMSLHKKHVVCFVDIVKRKNSSMYYGILEDLGSFKVKSLRKTVNNMLTKSFPSIEAVKSYIKNGLKNR